MGQFHDGNVKRRKLFAYRIAQGDDGCNDSLRDGVFVAKYLQAIQRVVRASQNLHYFSLIIEYGKFGHRISYVDY